MNIDITISVYRDDNTATRERRPAGRCRRVRALHGYRDLELRESGGGFRAGPPARPIYEAPPDGVDASSGGLEVFMGMWLGSLFEVPGGFKAFAHRRFDAPGFAGVSDGEGLAAEFFAFGLKGVD